MLVVLHLSRQLVYFGAGDVITGVAPLIQSLLENKKQLKQAGSPKHSPGRHLLLV